MKLEDCFNCMRQDLRRIATQMIEDEQSESAVALLNAEQMITAAVGTLAEHGVDLDQDFDSVRL